MKRCIQSVLLLLVLGFSIANAESPDAETAFYTLQRGDPRPEISVHRLDDGQVIPWEDMEGEVIVIDFWATWCAPCVEAFPDLNELAEHFADQPVRFVSVTYEPESKIRPFLLDHPLETTVAIDQDFQTFRSFKAWGIPAVYIFNSGGELVSVIHPEHLSEEIVEAVLEGQIPEVEQARGWPDPEGAEKYFRSLVEKTD